LLDNILHHTLLGGLPGGERVEPAIVIWYIHK
jgi:hypothetical protein